VIAETSRAAASLMYGTESSQAGSAIRNRPTMPPAGPPSHKPLTRRETFALTRYFNPAFGGPTDRQIGRDCGISRSAVCHRRRSGLAKLLASSDPAVVRLARAMRDQRSPRAGARRRVHACSLSSMENL
jgi:DNA-binding NarL/FixJ family response regulator